MAPSGYCFTHAICYTIDHKAPRHLEKPCCEVKSMFWKLIMQQTVNTHFLNTLQQNMVLTDSTWIPCQLWKMLYHGPQSFLTHGKPQMAVSIRAIGSLTPGYTALPCMKVNVLTVYTGSNNEYTLSKPTAIANSVDWLHLDIFPPMDINLPETRRRLNTWIYCSAMQVSLCSGHLHWIKPRIHTF